MFAPLLLLALQETVPSADVHDYLRAEMERRQIPGLVWGAMEDGELVVSGAAGYADLEWDVPMRRDAVFEIASLTKPITATAVLLLVQDGRVDLDDPIGDYVDGAPAAWKAIRVRHLLNHTSGLPEQTIAEHGGVPLLDVSTERQLALVREAPLAFAPGEGAQYSDPGYFLLGMVIERASGKPYGEALQELVFEPLGMTSSRVLDQWAIVPRRVAGYTLRDGELRNARRVWQHELPSFFGVLSTLDDLARFAAGLESGELLSVELLEEAQTPATLDDGRPVRIWGLGYGYGWMLSRLAERRVAEHGGFSGTHMLRIPDEGRAVIVLTNLDLRSGSQPHVLARGIAERLFAPGLRKK